MFKLHTDDCQHPRIKIQPDLPKAVQTSHHLPIKPNIIASTAGYILLHVKKLYYKAAVVGHLQQTNIATSVALFHGPQTNVQIETFVGTLCSVYALCKYNA